MLLKKLLLQTSASPNMVFRDPFKAVETDQLIQEIIGLANLDFAGPRYIVFGINKAAMEGNGVVGIDDEKLAAMKSAHQLVATLVKPALQLAFIYDEIDGKLAGAIEIDGCDDRPYQVACDFSETLTLGQSWTRDGMLFRAAEAGDLALMRPETGNPDEWNAALGIGVDADAQHVQLQAPDSSNPPSGRTGQRKGLGGVDWKQATIEAIGTMNTNIVRLMRSGKRSAPDMDDNDREALEFFQKNAEDRAAAADNYYYYEETALRLQFILRNDDIVALQDLELSLGFPKIDGLRVAKRVYPAPDGTTDARDAAGYPLVQVLKKGTFTTVKLGDVKPGTKRTVFSSPIRLAVNPRLHGRKMAIHCQLSAANKNAVELSRLTITFVAHSVDAQPARVQVAPVAES
jgi:hypothetical protein